MLFQKKCPQFQRVLHFFRQISAVPRQSHLTAPIADYLCRFAEERGLLYIRDAADNVIIKKAASAGAADCPALLLQAHTDMVLVHEGTANAASATQGISLQVKGDLMTAEGSSLGADDGIGMAYILAVLDDPALMHPMIEALFTSNEEVGLLGAAALDARVLTAKRMINLDSDEEGILTVGCAGGSGATLTLPFLTKVRCDCYALTLSGLPGGHSGTEIHKGIGNAILLLLAFLSELSADKSVSIAELSGGEASNAIPCFATAKFHCKADAEEILERAQGFLKKQSVKLGDAAFSIEECGTLPCLGTKESAMLTDFILALPSGILSMEEHIAAMPKTSLNLGRLEKRENALLLQYALRSSCDKERAALEKRICALARDFGGDAVVDGEYPAWSFLESSPLREACLGVYRRCYGEEATAMTVHAGLECSILSAKIEGLDAVSLGPNNKNIHTVDEALSLSSAARVWGYLCELLSALCEMP